MAFAIKSYKAAICAVLFVCVAGFAAALTKKGADMSLEQLTKASDDIVIGKIRTKKSAFVGRRIETDYEVEVHESLKGKNFAPGKSMQMTVEGGSVTTPPLTQYVEGAPVMADGEEVALFLRTQPLKISSEQLKKIPAKSKLINTPRIVGASQGKFSIVQIPSGARMVTRLNLEQRGVMPGDAVLSKTINAIEAGKMKTATRPIVPTRGAPSRDPLEITSANGLPSNLDPQQALSRFNASGPFPVQDFEQFKNDIKSFSQE